MLTNHDYLHYFLIGYESKDVHKPVPGKALLPVLDIFAPNALSEHTTHDNDGQQSASM